MSTTEIMMIKSNGDVVGYTDIQNAWRGGMHVWNSLQEKYNIHDKLFGVNGFKNTWAKFNKGFYQRHEDIVLGSTFDDVIVLKEDFGKLIHAFKMYGKEEPASSFSEQADIINKMIADEECIGVAWNQTSVCDDAWDFGYDEENDETIPYNIYKGSKHWNLFVELKESVS
ncbi:hypothetical protein [Enterococcus sp. AD013-P3]|uniref:hypothetical protein n=1 Tax=Enterococcus sp. AD013-P3 TaxID=3411036 RepID=UPI003B96405E